MNRMLSLDRIKDGVTRRDAWGYSPAGELTSAKYDLVNNLNPSRALSYALDNVGNRKSVTENGVATGYTPDNINRYAAVGGTAVGSGPGHQVSTYEGQNYAYIGDTYLASVNDGVLHSLTLGYDALGRCVQRNRDGAITYYLYDGEKPIQEVGATVASNLYGAGIDEIVQRDVSGNTYFFFQDHEGSVTHVADLGGLTERYRYDAFGAPTINAPFGALRSASLIGNRFMFTGREYDADFNIYEYRARAYSPYSGRFMTEDPKGFVAGDYNLFRYCKNDPLDLVDPMGLVGNGAQAVEVGKSVYGMQDTQDSVSAIVYAGGSPIPTRFVWSDTGNFNDPNIDHHVSNDMGDRGGVTRSHVEVHKDSKTNNIVITHDLNWWVKSEFKSTDVVTRETQDHVAHWRYWEKEGDGHDVVQAFARGPFTGTIEGAASDLGTKLQNSWATQFMSQYNDFDAPHHSHRLSDFPAKPLSQQEIANALSPFN